MKIALAQYDVKRGDPSYNYRIISGYAEKASQAGARALFLPEMCTTGFGWRRNRELLEQSEEMIHEIAGLALAYSISICGSFLEKTESGMPANTLYYFNSKGKILAKYRKVHLFTLFREEVHVEAGNEIVTAETELGKLGCAVCYDLRFPELFRKTTLSGAEVQCLPAAFPYPRLEHWRTLIRARAIENQCYFIATNQCGTEGHGSDLGEIHYFGHSMVVDPWGEVLLEAGEEEGLFPVEIDLSAPSKTRSRLTALKDRRPELY